MIILVLAQLHQSVLYTQELRTILLHNMFHKIFPIFLY